MAHIPRVFLKLGDIGALPARVKLPDFEQHYLVHVLRIKSRGKVTVVDKNLGRTYQAILLPGLSELEIYEAKETTSNFSPPITIGSALLKGKKTEVVIEKATELGAAAIILWQSERSVKRFKPVEVQHKLTRYQKISESASRQSRRNRIPEIVFACNVNELIRCVNKPSTKAALKIICDTGKDAPLLCDLIKPAPAIVLVTGPEGDFSELEHKSLIESGFFPASLGPNILRAETAAISAVATATMLSLKVGRDSAD
ncbi:MAG: 16S rRNA (uracil(1498)-N(3))-methyltransferase [Candidatus Dadabacteria bacterium]|nr:MAG: 16S rRNA (uracil(1498)-N(3))-methyltransferase [Candidatus Dadabacteria bacterium]